MLWPFNSRHEVSADGYICFGFSIASCNSFATVCLALFRDRFDRGAGNIDCVALELIDGFRGYARGPVSSIGVNESLSHAYTCSDLPEQFWAARQSKRACRGFRLIIIASLSVAVEGCRV